MAGPSWLVDPKRIATKIKSASGTSEHSKVQWKSNPTRACPNCEHIIDNSDVALEWPGLPRGVKFDPSDQEIIEHLLGKVGIGNSKSHPFINEFILTLEGDDGICYTHPQNLPGVKQDGSVSHFFHRAIKAYNTGTRKRRKIHGEDFGDVRWHKTGRTKPVILDGVHKGCKKIMVLYMTLVRGGKPEKTNWVMHQYHLGTGEDEKDGEYVISKVFYQQQPIIKGGDKTDGGSPEAAVASIVKVDPVTPKSVTPDPPRSERQSSDFELVEEPNMSTGPTYQHPVMDYVKDDIQADIEWPAQPDQQNVGNNPSETMDDIQVDIEWPAQPDPQNVENHASELMDDIQADIEWSVQPDLQNVENHPSELMDDNEHLAQEEPKWWDSESQHLLDSQQLVEALSLCEDLLQSQSPNRDENGNDRASDAKPRLSDYAQLGPKHLKKDIEECQKIELDPANIELDTPPEFRLSQLEFGSQDSFLDWGSSRLGD